MLAEQLGVGIAGRLSGWAYAYARDRRLSDLACAIVAWRLRLRLRLHPDPDPRQDG